MKSWLFPMSASNHHPNQTVSISPREDYLGPSYWTIGNPGAYEPPTLIQPHQENLLFSSPPNIHGSLESQVGLNVHIDGQRDIGHNAFRSGVRSNTVNKEFDLEVGKNPHRTTQPSQFTQMFFRTPRKVLAVINSASDE
ncbi:hypothetical protein JCM33374_g4596 [Metschnikowia sp. JCM 33374]|nr:hypothetical protein JCM33374_g4596 [Metschnikowia sp. JCM 33374]